MYISVMHNPRPTSGLYAACQQQITHDRWQVNKCHEMHNFNFAQLRQQRYIKLCKFSLYLHSDVLRWISVGLFPPDKTSAHVTACGGFLLCFTHPRHTCRVQSRQKIKLFYRNFPTWKRSVLGFVRVAATGATMASVCSSRVYPKVSGLSW
jgi:hypothetical protein